jgi:thymidylate kinase
MVKISFSGISGSGKTSLQNEVRKILSLKYRVASVDEINARNPYDADKKSSFISQFFYISTQINEENIQASNPVDYLLCDRSVFDQWIYWKDYLMSKEMNPSLEEKNKLLEHLYRFWVKTYDLIFLVRLDEQYLDSREFNKEFRKIDRDYISKMEKLYLDIAGDDRLKMVEIWNNKSVDESAHEIIGTISDFQPPAGSAG